MFTIRQNTLSCWGSILKSHPLDRGSNPFISLIKFYLYLLSSINNLFEIFLLSTKTYCGTTCWFNVKPSVGKCIPTKTQSIRVYLITKAVWKIFFINWHYFDFGRRGGHAFTCCNLKEWHCKVSLRWDSCQKNARWPKTPNPRSNK